MEEIDYSLFWKMFECIRQHEPKDYSREKYNILNSLSKKKKTKGETIQATTWKVVRKYIKSISKVSLNYS